MNRDRWQKLVLGVGAVALLVLWIGIYTETKECEAKGGKRMRGLLEGFKCYDVSALRVLP